MYSTSVYFGNLFYWKNVAQDATVMLDMNDVYQKQSFRNRQEILSANGKQALSIPVIRSNGSKTLTKDVFISTAENWQKDHWKAIESAYKHAPYFWYYGNQIKELIYQEEESLLKFNLKIQEAILKFLSIDIKLNLVSNAPSINSKKDMRILLNDKKLEYNSDKYLQVFSDKLEYENNLSILDALMNIGPMARVLIFS